MLLVDNTIRMLRTLAALGHEVDRSVILIQNEE
jgi:hypothetical protein